jgi:hypothetical protein
MASRDREAAANLIWTRMEGRTSTTKTATTTGSAEAAAVRCQAIVEVQE